MGPYRQLSALLRMLNPKLILSKYVLTAELTPLPIHTLPIPAAIPSHMLVTILQIQSHSALATLCESVGLLAFIQQVMCELSDIYVPVALVAIYQHLAVIYIVLSLVLVLLGAIGATTPFLIGVFIVYPDLLVL